MRDLDPERGASDASSDAQARHDPYRALRYRNFRLLFIGIFLSSIGEQMVTVAIGWELYDRTHSALALGLVGLVQVLPVLCFSLLAGHLADRLNRRRMVMLAQTILALCSLGLMLLSWQRGPLWLIYGCLLLIGTATAFNEPASAALLPQTLPAALYANAATWESSAWQLASVVGPALGGFLVALFRGATPVYGLNALAIVLYLLLLALLRLHPAPAAPSRSDEQGKEGTLRSLAEGLHFLRRTQVILAAITLDLFAVLFGGATTLLPIYARDILQVGPTGLGWLQAAPSIGAVCVAFLLAHLPPFKRAGRTLLLAVAGFGLATIVFGLSRSFWLSLLMLFILGGLDNISVVIRGTLLMTRTPDHMRGRVAAVNTIFIATSNKLGGFESGLAAQLFGPVPAVVGGGLGTILVVLCVALIWPEMRRLGTLAPAGPSQATGQLAGQIAAEVREETAAQRQL
ncbi:MFS transporter [Thermogemmatispora tikiterensis]|uniref:MFS transporter n=1 Tax=Thermogemmatispora tikiterensis TaxID=1825093 RepID=A0A328VP71_9CHLR|nr:MFS transporter [Thermogemmatispora tikiterensis]RAQ97580.1 MFS transporter [Thermogemmatispora tikiterensis]